jgi:hypothetical protein
LGFNLAANGGRLNGFVPFPQSSYWHRDVSGLSPDSNSARYINDVNRGGNPYGWLGNYPGTSAGTISGALWHVVSGSQPRVNVYFDVPQSVGYFTNGSATVTWVSGAYFDGLGGAGASMVVASAVGNWYEGSTISAAINSVGACAGGSNCTTAVLSSPFTGLTGNHAINNTSIPSQSDPGPMPIPLAPRVQNSLTNGNPFPNYPVALSTDGHVVVVDKDNCVLYELFNVGYDGRNVHVGTAAIFDLQGGDNQRPTMWTSTSVSGLPLFPGMLRDDELNGSVPINHPLVTTAFTYCGSGNFFPHHSWISPAEHHQYGGGSGGGTTAYWQPNELPFGSILRLKSSFNTSGYPAQAQLILNAMKTYGLIIVDGGCTMAHYGSSNWNADPASIGDLYVGGCSGCAPFNTNQFDVITTGNPIYCDPLYASPGLNGGNLPLCPNSTSSLAGSVPLIASFTPSSSTVSAGQSVTLSWNVAGASTRLRFVTPNIGPVVTNSVTVTIAQSTTYTLTVQNQYGRSTATVTVNVRP